MTFGGRISPALVLAVALGAPARVAQAQTAPAPEAAPATVAPSPAPALPAVPPDKVVPDYEAATMAALLGEHVTDVAAEPSLKLYGFADFNAVKWMNLSNRWNGTLPQPLSFYVGKLNVYMEANIAPEWKSLIEVRYMFIPNGSGTPNPYVDPIGNAGRFDGIAPDYTELDRPVEWGGINIQRAYLEHSFTNFLSVRVGRFLTPWGIWNVDHGSPVIIGTAKPYVIGESFFPEAQTGFDAFGSVSVGDSTLSYHLTLSNGRGATEAFQDMDDNKAIGGRLSLRMYALGELTVGLSGYGGTVTDRRQQLNLQTMSLSYFNYEHYREVSWAADVRWLWKDLHFQTEAAVHDRVWDDNARPISGAGVQADVRRFGMYALLGYRLPWLNLMPYMIYSYYDTGSRAAFNGPASQVQVWSWGLNIRINPSIVFKVEYQRGSFLDPTPGTMFEDALQQLSSQLAWAF
jgi:hypothetical protein